MDQERFIWLLKRKMDQSISETELSELNDLLQKTDDKSVFVESFTELMKDQTPDQEYDEQRFDPMIDFALNIDKQLPEFNYAARPAHRVHFLRTAWFRYAAAIILIFGTAAYLWKINSTQKKDSTLSDAKAAAVKDIVAGGNKAMLTLADGSTIILDSAANGQLALQDGAKIIKEEGQIIYGSGSSSSPSNNTMSTPRGGQYRLTLPDGTKVWLNAASSITYPTAFTGKERSVKVTGEVYFEVAKNKTKQFIVNTDKEIITVLGTHFNVNAYANEGSVKTTLLEGSVKVLSGSGTVMLQPGEQAKSDGKNLSVIKNVNVDQVMGWKNGFFYFNGSDVYGVMREIERWYDIDVKYEGKIRARQFAGEIERNLNLSQILNVLGYMELKYRMEGKTLIIIQ